MRFPEGNIEYLIYTGFEEIMIFLLILIVPLIVCTIVRKRWNFGGKALALALLTAKIGYVLQAESKAEIFLSIIFAVGMTGQIALMKILEFDLWDNLVLLASFLVPPRFFNSSYALFGYGIYYLMVLTVVFLYGKFRKGSLKGNMLCYYVTFLYLSAVTFLYQLCSNEAFADFREGELAKPAFVGLVFLLFLLISIFTCCVRPQMYVQLIRINTIGKKHPEVERIVLYLTLFTVMVFMLIPMPFLLTRTMTDVLMSSLAFFYLILIFLQVIFMILLYHVADYKQTLVSLVQISEDREQYYDSLNQNLEDMRKLRHDMKNLFMTMGRFVERSKDEEMKQFYHDNLYPYAMSELEKNYLFSKLYEVPDENLRAFLFMKITQAYQKKINIQLNILLERDAFQLGMDTMELTRILGILLDNAIEEGQNQENAFLDLSIRNNDKEISYSIKNSLSSDCQLGRILNEGKSGKQGHSGLGLTIVKNILEDYPNVMLNTYFDKEYFQQTLIVNMVN